MLSKEGERKERERGENSNVRVKDKVKTKQVDFLLIKTGKNSALLYGNFSTGKWDLWDFGIMGFGNYGICDLWDFGIMGEGGEEGRNRERKVGQEPWSITTSDSKTLLKERKETNNNLWARNNALTINSHNSDTNKQPK